MDVAIHGGVLGLSSFRFPPVDMAGCISEIDGFACLPLKVYVVGTLSLQKRCSPVATV